MVYTSSKARHLIEESREYRGLYRVKTYKKRARRVERRHIKRELKSQY